ncbi:MAG TPA: hypothetical protein VFO17_02355, partial [Acidimicrobiia bacterium]|nr:hypothetical protein [Acidimicrobiia bacterium]
MKRYMRLLALLAVLGMVLAACSPADEGGEGSTTEAAETPSTTEAAEPTTTEAPAGSTTTGAMTGEPVVVCLVTDLAGVDDRSFNAAAWQGVLDAVEAGVAVEDPLLLES